jgi:hypothetical protein
MYVTYPFNLFRRDLIINSYSDKSGAIKRVYNYHENLLEKLLF